MSSFSKANLYENYQRILNPQRVHEESPSRGGIDSKYALRGYLEAALWSSGGTKPDGKEVENLDDEYSVKDIDQTSIDLAKADLTKFIDRAEQADVLDAYLTLHDWYAFGHDFWLTRNGHGVGFWDRDGIDDEVGKKLTSLAEEFGGLTPYIGDDEKIYIE